MRSPRFKTAVLSAGILHSAFNEGSLIRLDGRLCYGVEHISLSPLLDAVDQSSVVECAVRVLRSAQHTIDRHRSFDLVARGVPDMAQTVEGAGGLKKVVLHSPKVVSPLHTGMNLRDRLQLQRVPKRTQPAAGPLSFLLEHT